MKTTMLSMLILCAIALLNTASADTFGSGSSEFTIEFVTISAATNPTDGYGIVNYDYRIAMYEITVNQWRRAGFSAGYWAGNQSAASITWFQAAQFVNKLNTEKGYQPAYNLTGGTLNLWDTSSAWDQTNLYRHKNAYYFLPTEDEWVKAAYWNGTELQTYATHDDTKPQAGTDSNYNHIMTNPWIVGTGSQELNGTFDMMGNLWEWTESPWISQDYLPGSNRTIRGGAYIGSDVNLISSNRISQGPGNQNITIGFRVASIPEPATVLLLSLGGLALIKRRPT
jgi:formylglycine-generating enzyme required for sulfatase activity